MPHLRDISGGKPLRPGAVNGRDESLVAIGTDDNGLAAQISNLQNAALTHNLDARVVSVIARANAGDAAQRAVLEPNLHQRGVVEMRRTDPARFALEVRDLGIHAFQVRPGEPADGIPIMAVHLGQHAIGCTKVTCPRGREAGTMRKRLDQHGTADLAGLDSRPGRLELRIIAAHESDLKDYAAPLA